MGCIFFLKCSKYTDFIILLFMLCECVCVKNTILILFFKGKHGEGGENGDNLFKKLCCLGVSREIGDTDRGNLWSQGYFFSLIFNDGPLDTFACCRGWGRRGKKGSQGQRLEKFRHTYLPGPQVLFVTSPLEQASVG